MELVFFSIMGDCVCKIVCQFFGMGSFGFVCFLVGVYLYWVFFFGIWGLCLVLGLSVCGLVSM